MSIEGDSKQEPAGPTEGVLAEESKEVTLQDAMKELEMQLKAEQDKSESILTKMKYLQADFDNYKKRVGKELADAKLFVNEKLITMLLDVRDEFELALKVAKEKGNVESLVGGVEMTLKKFLDILAKEGLSKIETYNRRFDPNLHEAVEIVPTEGKEDGTIVDEIRAGYLLNGKVLRPSMVKVASSANS